MVGTLQRIAVACCQLAGPLDIEGRRINRQMVDIKLAAPEPGNQFNRVDPERLCPGRTVKRQILQPQIIDRHLQRQPDTLRQHEGLFVRRRRRRQCGVAQTINRNTE